MSDHEQLGELSLLNVGTGDTKISFDPKNKADVLRASRVVKDMLKKGYAILIEAGSDEKGPLYRRALDFDPKTMEYIIAGAPEPEPTLKPIGQPPELTEEITPSVRPSKSRRGRRAGTTRVAAKSTRGVAVAPTAGG